MDVELEAMAKILQALDNLSQIQKERVINWVIDRYDLKGVTNQSGIKKGNKENTNEEESNIFETSAELYDKCGPKTPSEKVLVAGYWHQEIMGEKELVSNILNKDLKHLGHGIIVISKKFDTLINSKPSLVLQLKKQGTSKQAHKKYKLTQAGINFIKDKLTGN